MSPVTAETVPSGRRRLAQALVQGGYDTESNLDPAARRGEATDQTLGHAPDQQEAGAPGRRGRSTWPSWRSCRPSTWRRCTPSPEARSCHARRRGPGVHEAVALQFDGNVLAVAFAEPPSPQRRRRAWRSLVGHRSIRCWPTPWSSIRCCVRCCAGGAPVDPPPPPGPARPTRRWWIPSDADESGARTVARQAARTGIPAAATDGVDAPPHRRPPPLCGDRRGVGPPPDGADAAVDPAARGHPADRRMSAARQRDPPRHGLRRPSRPHSGSGSRPSTSSTPPTRSPASGGSG